MLLTFYVNTDNVADCKQCKVGATCCVFDSWSTTKYYGKGLYQRGRVVCWCVWV